ncbi:hypothetical protein M5G11_26545, partial [Pseudomonas sp. TNT2022 ID681]
VFGYAEGGYAPARLTTPPFSLWKTGPADQDQQHNSLRSCFVNYGLAYRFYVAAAVRLRSPATQAQPLGALTGSSAA